MKVGHILWKTAKIILITLGSLILLVVILLAAAKLSENKIVGLVLNKVSVELKAPFSVREVNLLPLRNFPNLTVELQDFSVGKSTDSLQSGQSSNPFDTLFSLHKLYVAVKAKPLLSSKVVVDQVEIDGA
ncbi:MAG: AsmA family protein, partial [Bacteroidales bacterium]|nr:AsmA family protein [Bacteroidales bacterium]